MASIMYDAASVTYVVVASVMYNVVSVTYVVVGVKYDMASVMYPALLAGSAPDHGTPLATRHHALRAPGVDDSLSRHWGQKVRCGGG